MAESPATIEVRMAPDAADLRGAGIGAALLEAVWGQLAGLGVEDLAVTTHEANEGARRFYESNQFESAFVTYHAKRVG